MTFGEIVLKSSNIIKGFSSHSWSIESALYSHTICVRRARNSRQLQWGEKLRPSRACLLFAFSFSFGYVCTQPSTAAVFVLTVPKIKIQILIPIFSGRDRATDRIQSPWKKDDICLTWWDESQHQERSEEKVWEAEGRGRLGECRRPRSRSWSHLEIYIMCYFPTTASLRREEITFQIIYSRVNLRLDPIECDVK